MVLVGISDLSLLAFFFLILAEEGPLEQILLGFVFCVFVEDEYDAAIMTHDS
jgi:hypothetical protein